jgi:DNA-binding response OmpR family regulator
MVDPVRILIVSNKPEAQHAQTRTLQRAGFSVEAIRSGQVEIPVIRLKRPDIVLIDFTLEHGVVAMVL